MIIPDISEQTISLFKAVLSKCTIVEGLICIGKLRGGYIFTYKYPEGFKNNFLGGETVYAYVKDDNIVKLSSFDDPAFYGECEILLASIDQDKCYIIKKP